MVIFGASGDLTKRKLIPALFDLYGQQMLPNDFIILGCGRTQINNNDFSNIMREELSKKFPSSLDIINSFLEHLVYNQLDPYNESDYKNLSKRLEELSGRIACDSNYLYYFAIPPAAYGIVAKNLWDTGLTCSETGWKRVIVEKPFGKDLQSATELNHTLLQYFNEDQIYRIDHYLGKESVQNILVTRFSNTVFEPLWNRIYIDYVEITSSEALSVGARAGYYDKAGALRDMLQNHLLQILGIVAMEPPINADATSIRNEMVKVFQSLRPINESDVKDFVVRGQYTSSVINGKQINGYLQEPGIPQNSQTETYVAMRCFIENWRWSGVPFYIRTGKSLPARVTEIVIHFKSTPYKIFNHNSSFEERGDQLIIRIQPDEGLQLKIGMKEPGAGFKVEPVDLDFRYTSLNHYHIPEAYERLLCDCMFGDATLYQRDDAVKATWAFVQPVLDAWAKNLVPLYTYQAGTWGPKEADSLTAKDGRTWRYPCKNLVGSNLFCEL